MRRIVLVVALVAALFSTGDRAGAAIYWDTDIHNTYMNSGGSAGQRSVSDVFNIRTAENPLLDQGGFRPGVETVTNAWLRIGVSDDLKPWTDPFDFRGWSSQLEYVEVQLGSQSYTWEVDLGQVLGAAATAIVLYDINDDGEVQYTVRATQGDFWLGFAKLTAESLGSVVPEPSSVLVWCLIGLPVLGAACWRRRNAA